MGGFEGVSGLSESQRRTKINPLGMTIVVIMLQASLGTGSLPPGWEKGLAGSCVGERRSKLLCFF